MLHFYQKVLIAFFVCLLCIACGVFVVDEYFSSYNNQEQVELNQIKYQYSQFDSSTQEILFTVKTQGVYQVCQKNLPKNNWGNFENIKILNRTHEVQHWLVNENNQICIRFYAGYEATKYSDSGYYRFVNNKENSAPTPVTKLASSQVENRLVYTPVFYQEYSENNYYEPTYPGNEPWFWKRISQKELASISIDPVNVPGKLNRIRIDFWAKTDHPFTYTRNIIPHQLQFSINNNNISEFQFSGKETQAYIDIPMSFDKQSSLNLSVNVSDDSDILGDIIYLDQMVLFFDPDEHMNEIGMFVGKRGQIQIQSGNNLSILELDGREINQIYIVDSKPNLNFWLPTKENLLYIIFPDKDIIQIDEFSIIDLNLIEQSSDGADYLIIGDEKFIEPAETLINYREQQGLITKFVDIQSIFNHYGYGYPEPEAIQAYLKSVLKNWKLKPRYLLLLGDYSFDLKNYRRNPKSTTRPLPSSFIFTQFGGWTVSDSDMVDTDRDGVIDISTGRIPVKQPEELVAVIDKIISYENKIKRRSRIEYVGLLYDDGFQPTTNDYEFQDDRFRIINQSQGIANREMALSEFNNSTFPVLFYMGHGSLTQIGSHNLFGVSDIRKDNQPENYGTLFLFTCLSGYFVHPQVDSLVEELLLSPNTSFSAIVGPTTLTLPENQIWLVNRIANELLNSSPGARIGDVFRSANNEYLLDKGVNLDVLLTFTLFGDPAMTIK